MKITIPSLMKNMTPMIVIVTSAVAKELGAIAVEYGQGIVARSMAVVCVRKLPTECVCV